MPKLLTANAQKGWPYFQRLLVDLFQFMEPFLRNAELGDPVCLYFMKNLHVSEALLSADVNARSPVLVNHSLLGSVSLQRDTQGVVGATP